MTIKFTQKLHVLVFSYVDCSGLPFAYLPGLGLTQQMKKRFRESVCWWPACFAWIMSLSILFFWRFKKHFQVSIYFSKCAGNIHCAVIAQMMSPASALEFLDVIGTSSAVSSFWLCQVNWLSRGRLFSFCRKLPCAVHWRKRFWLQGLVLP